MKTIYFRLSVFALFALMLISSCRKIAEDLPAENITAEDVGKSKPFKNYRIKRILFQEYFGDYYGDFFYNKQGDPDSVTFGIVGTGYPNLYFSYDKKQLRELRELYEDGAYETWHRFGYTGSRITTDTVYSIGDGGLDPEPDNYLNKVIRYFEYDGQGRIVTESWQFIDPSFPPLVFTYTYGADGNLLSEDGTPLLYDDQANPHQLHEIWQFLARDYSVNNPISAINYTSIGLPAQFSQMPDFPSNYTFAGSARSLESSVIEYDKKQDMQLR